MHSSTVDTAAPPAPPNTVRQRIGVPAYFDPGPGWDNLLKAVPSVALAILNLDSGPGPDLDPDIEVQAVAAHKAGLALIGYVDTANGRRDSCSVRAEASQYFDWYAVDGIFFDQAHVAPKTFTSYYRPLYEFVKEASARATVVLNPGTDVSECVLSAADIVVDFESTYGDYLRWKPPEWTKSHPATRFWHIVYDVATCAQLHRVQKLSQLRGAGYLYGTDQAETPRPPDVHLYDRLPHTHHWSELQRGLSGSHQPDRATS